MNQGSLYPSRHQGEQEASVDIVDEVLLAKADGSGCVSGGEKDKSERFGFISAYEGALMIPQRPVVMG